MDNINFSIIIPHYNSPDTLKKLLDTIPSEKKDIQIIVVDDRSDDRTEELNAMRKDGKYPHVDFYRNNKGTKGPGTCRNIGIKHATGKWLIFADADDMFTEDFYSAVSEYADSDAEIVYFNAVSIRDDGSAGERHKCVQHAISSYIKDKIRYNELKLRTDCVVPWAKMVSRDFVNDKHIRFGDMMVSEDVVFCIKGGISAKKIMASEKVIYCVSEGSSLTYSYDKEKNRENISTNNRVFIWMYKYLKDNLSRDDWKMLGLNGNMRVIDAIQRDYGMINILKMIIEFEISGVKAIDIKGMRLSNFKNRISELIKNRKRIAGR